MRHYFSYQEMHLFSISYGFNRLRNCNRDILKYLEEYFHTGRVFENVKILTLLETPLFFTKLPDIGKVFEVMKDNHGVKISSPDRGKIWAVGAPVHI